MTQESVEIDLIMQIWKEGNMYVSYSPDLDISSCGGTSEEAKRNLYEAIEALLEEAERMGTLQDILEEAGFVREDTTWRRPDIIATERVRFAFSP
ncbi:MAG: type II toxin-antitoxin system HicB family antitoxin [Deltaproteobacteria bacterium]|nr:type II toxin-antitoxin system HicB family antitoxin [Deltaproteobacteria bacterium]